jgi:hypothetical protein
MKRRIRKFLGAVAVVGGVLAPTAALANDYPTPSSTPTVDSVAVSGAQVTRPASSGGSGGSTLPFTGGEIAALALAGASVTGAGVVLVGIGRRRRAQIQS